MDPALLIVLFALGAIAVYAIRRYLKARRRQELTAAAARLGLQYSPEDHLGLVGLPFALFSRGDGRGTENLVWGEWSGATAYEFDYWYYEESADSKGSRSRTYHRFSCAVTEIPASCPHLQIARETILSRLADAVGFDDIAFESEEFNRAFNVNGDDRKFATDMIDARMMEWLLSAGATWGYEVRGSHLLCHAKRLRPSQIDLVLGCLDGFRRHIPRVVWDLYPAR